MTDRTRNKRTRDDPSSFPPEIVCTSKAAHGRNNAVELGVVISLVVVGLYFFAIIESAANLPELSTKRNPHNLFGNLNMAKLQPIGGASESHRALQAAASTSGTHNTAPPATWPVNFKHEINNVETILHPGDQVTKMTVPKFWSPPLHNREFYTREQAMSVGTCVEADASGNHVRGDDCPVHQRTIFIAIASYRDFQCRRTIESAFTRAQYPERIRVGVVDQIINGEDVVCNDPIEPCDENPNQALCKYQDQIDVYEMPAQLSVGPVVARHIGDRLYRGEYYATQSDAHVSFTEKWDSDIISQLEASHNEMAVLTTYLTDVQGSIGPKGNSLRSTRPIMCNTYYEGGPQGLHLRHGSQPERPPSIHGSPQLAPWWAAGYSFSRGHFVVNVPYDLYQPMIFQGEEMSIGIRGWTVGYDFYAPERSVCFHHYAVGKNAKIRNKVKHFWENSDRYAGTGRRAMARLLGIVHMNPEVDPSKWDHTEEDIYGLGGVRTPEKFYTLFGIDVVQKKTQGHLCMLVDEGQGKMHKLFTPKLRADGMGIDYDQITYRWKDPRPDLKQPR